MNTSGIVFIEGGDFTSHLNIKKYENFKDYNLIWLCVLVFECL